MGASVTAQERFALLRWLKAGMLTCRQAATQLPAKQSLSPAAEAWTIAAIGSKHTIAAPSQGCQQPANEEAFTAPSVCVSAAGAAAHALCSVKAYQPHCKLQWWDSGLYGRGLAAGYMLVSQLACLAESWYMRIGHKCRELAGLVLCTSASSGPSRFSGPRGLRTQLITPYRPRVRCESRAKASNGERVWPP